MDREEWLLMLGKIAAKSDTTMAHAMLHAVAVEMDRLKRCMEHG